LPAKIPQPLLERGDAQLAVGVVFGADHQYAQLAHGLRLLRARRQRPGHPAAAENGDNLEPFHLDTPKG